jgi:hypothetical protein
VIALLTYVFSRRSGTIRRRWLKVIHATIVSIGAGRELSEQQRLLLNERPDAEVIIRALRGKSTEADLLPEIATNRCEQISGCGLNPRIGPI